MSHHILVVDDDRSIREIVQAALEDEDFAVTTATNGREALERIAESRPDVILLDLNMPVMDGWAFHARVRDEGLRIPVVFMTAGQHACVEAARCGAEGCLPKPFGIDELYGAVSRFVA